MAKPKFQWDADALVPEVIEIDFAPITGKEDKVAFHEFPRMILTEFVEESLALKVIKLKEDGTPEKDDDGNEIRKSFGEVEKEHSAFLFKYLAKAAKDKKTAEEFGKMDLTVKAMSGLVDMLLKLNHVDEVLATSGNWLMLPTVMAFLAEADAKSQESASQSVTSEA